MNELALFAGAGAGISGERSGLWKEFARIIREVRPGNVLVENSPALTSRGLDTVLWDLAALGYDAEWGVLGAADVGAPHQRDRIWIVAYTAEHLRNTRRPEPARQQRQARATDGGDDVAYPERAERWPESAGQCEDQWRQHADGLPEWQEDAGGLGTGCEVVADTYEKRRLRRPWLQRAGRRGKPENSSWWTTEPDVGRVVNGLAARVDRLTALGNGQVPACAAEAWCRLTADR